MTEPSHDHDPLGDLAEEFLDRLRRGEHPPLTEYTQRHPELSARIRNVFPTLAIVEDLVRDRSLDPVSPNASSLDVPPIPPQVGDYRIVREIGRGGMGIVFEAEQLSLKRSVALKILSVPHRDQGNSWERFQREARVTARLHHTNIVSAFDVGVQNGVCYLAMQFIQGRSLDDVILELRRLRNPVAAEIADKPRHSSDSAAELARSIWLRRGITNNSVELTSSTERHSTAQNLRQATHESSNERSSTGLESLPAAEQQDGRLSETLLSESTASIDVSSRQRFYENIAQLIQQVAEALDFAHAAGIVHRDIKPSNLLLDFEGRLWVTDFGLAKEDEVAVTQSGDVLGTLRYMAPEQFQGRAERRSDLYALGVTLYELLTLEPAFPATDRAQLVRQIMEVQPLFPRSIDAEIPRDLETICLKLLEKDPHRRFNAAREVVEELGRFLRHEPIRSRPLSVIGRFSRWCRRNPVVAGLSTALLLAMSSGLIGVAMQWQRAERNWIQAESNATKATTASLHASAEAERAKTFAAEAEFARDRLRETAYVAHLNLIQQAWNNTDVARVVELLDRQRPQGSAADLRGFEWGYWWHQTHRYTGELSFGNSPVLAFDLIEKPSQVELSKDHESAGDSSNDCRLVVALNDGTASGRVLLCNIQHDRRGVQHQVVAELSGHTALVKVVRVSPDQRWIVTGSADHTVRLWDAASGAQLKTLSSHTGSVNDLAFSPDGRRLASVSGGPKAFGEVRLWSVPKGELLESPPTPNTSPMHSVSFLNDSQVAIGVTQIGQIYVYGGSPLKRVARMNGHQRLTTALDVSADRKLLASASWDGSVRLWEAESLSPIRELAGHSAEVETCAIHPNNKLLASAGRDQTIRLWDVPTGRMRSLLKCRDAITKLRFSQAGDWLLVGSHDGTLRWWSVADALLDEPFAAHEQPCAAVAVSPDGRSLATSGQDHRIVLWDMATRRVRYTLLGHTRVPWRILFDPAGRTLMSCGDGELRQWDVESGACLKTVKVTPQTLYALASARDGRLLAAGGRNAIVWLFDGRTFEQLHACRGHTGSIRDIDFSDDGKWIASAADDGTVRLWDAGGEPLRVLSVPGAKFIGVRMTPDRTRIIAGSDDGRLHVWNASNGDELATLHGSHRDLSALTLSPRGDRLATSSRDHTVKLWDLRTGEPTLTLDAHQSPVLDVTFNSSGTTLVTADEAGLVRVWDTRDLTPQ